MTETIAAQPPRAAAIDAPPLPSRGRSVLVASIGVIAGAALAAGVAWWVVRSTPPAKVQPMRFAIAPAAALPLAPTNADRQLVVSPDGTHLVYVGGRVAGGGQLMIRTIDQIEAVPLRGIITARSPFISPDGKWIAYFDTASNELRKVSITGGPPISLCKTAVAARGGTWGPDDTIVFATSDLNTGLLGVPAGGGEPKVLTKPDTAHGDTGHWFPSFLPGGHAVLYTIRPTGGLMDNAQVAVLDLKTGKTKTLIRGGTQAEYVDPSTSSRQGSSTSATGLLVYAVAGSLRAVRFDPIKLEVLSDPVAVLDQVSTLASGAAEYTVSRTGALVYVPGGRFAGFGRGAVRTLAWVDRRGHEESISAPGRSYVSPRLSPDGTTIALDARDQELDIWTFDLARKTLQRLTMDPGVDGYPVWTPDGRRIIFESNRGGGVFNLYSQAADGTGAPEPLTKSANPVWPFSISLDGTRMVLHESGSKTGNDLDMLVMDGKSKPEPLIQTPFSEEHGEISPDGRWLAYDSNDSGQQQVHVRPFPDVNSGHWQVSPSGGSKPVWAHNGKELFYLSGPAMMAVPVQTTTSFSAGTPVKLFEGSYFSEGTARVYDVSRDGQKFLMIKEPPTTTDPTATQASMVVVLNWVEELRARLSAR
jgi:Tol biopolymer transport system component